MVFETRSGVCNIKNPSVLSVQRATTRAERLDVGHKKALRIAPPATDLFQRPNQTAQNKTNVEHTQEARCSKIELIHTCSMFGTMSTALLANLDDICFSRWVNITEGFGILFSDRPQESTLNRPFRPNFSIKIGTEAIQLLGFVIKNLLDTHYFMEYTPHNYSNLNQ